MPFIHCISKNTPHCKVTLRDEEKRAKKGRKPGKHLRDFKCFVISNTINITLYIQRLKRVSTLSINRKFPDWKWFFVKMENEKWKLGHARTQYFKWHKIDIFFPYFALHHETRFRLDTPFLWQTSVVGRKPSARLGKFSITKSIVGKWHLR